MSLLGVVIDKKKIEKKSKKNVKEEKLDFKGHPQRFSKPICNKTYSLGSSHDVKPPYTK